MEGNTMEKAHSAKRKWIILAILAMAGGIIYELPYIQYTYYKPLQEMLGFDNATLGSLMTMYGWLAMATYLPGGWMADRFSHRKLIAFSLVGTGLGGFYLATAPGLMGARVLFAFWGVTSILTFWSTLLKATSLLGDEKEQGRLFSFLEGGRGVVTSIAALSCLAIFNAIGQTGSNFRYIICIYAAICVLVGVAAFFFMEDNKPTDKKSINVLKDMWDVAKMPITWLLVVVIFCIYTTYSSSSYMTPYMNDVFGLSAVAAGVVATFRSHIFRPIAGLVGGTVSKKIGSSIVVMLGAIVIAIVALIVLVVTPVNAALVVVIAAITILVGFLLFVLRGLYFAPVGEVGTPKPLLGAAVGLISTVAFASDIFNFQLLGGILDRNKDTIANGYKQIFLYMIGLLVVSFVGLLFLRRTVNKHKTDKAA